MKEKTKQYADCARAEDLVTYLYGEASEQEAAEFKRHMEQCNSCCVEMAAFSRAREDVVEWRNQSLPSFEFSRAVAPAYSEAADAVRKRAAMAALRQFFMLAPAWMRAATAVAALVICALVVFTAIHFSEQPGTLVQVSTQAPTEAQADEMTKRRAEELRQKGVQEAIEKQAALAQEKPPVESVKDNNASPRTKSRRPTVSSVASAQQKRMAPDKAKASQEARQQLAELVQTSKEDDGLPRLSDLIDDASDSN